MKISFMSWLYPGLELDAMIAKARKYGYDGIEFRTEVQHRHGVEPGAPADSVRAARSRMADAGLVTCCLAPGIKFCSPDAAQRDANLQQFSRYVDLAVAVGSPCIRLFADPIPNLGRGQREESYRVQADYLRRAAERAVAGGVRIGLETHSNFRAVDAGEVLFRAAYPPALWINWHLEHCINHGEDVDEAYRHVKGRVTHAHFSMSPHVERQMELLHAEGFAGHFSLELMEKDEAKADQLVAQQIEQWRAVHARL